MIQGKTQFTMKQIIDHFYACSQLKFSGKLELKNVLTQWTFYYRRGQIIWAAGGLHPVRRYLRQMSTYCPDLKANKLRFRSSDFNIDFWQLELLDSLYQHNRITREQITAILNSTIKELLFDIIQQAFLSGESSLLSKSQREEQKVLNLYLTQDNIENFIHQKQEVHQTWQAWSDAGLQQISPHKAPILCQPKKMRQKLPERLYKIWANLLTGKWTLSDLSVKMKQNLLPLTKSLVYYIDQGMIELVKVTDLPLPVTLGKVTSDVQTKKKKTSALIACIDDSPQVCQLIKEIVTQAGYRFISIQNPLEAIPMLIEYRPNLILLDLIMPVANGYEICSQVRRVSILATTPVIIITGKDGLVDRVRAKMVGASNFISKPIEPKKLLATIRKYKF